jgi:hypothetical protein
MAERPTLPLVRDEEAAGSNPATPTRSQATCDLRGWPVAPSSASTISLMTEAIRVLESALPEHADDAVGLDLDQRRLGRPSVARRGI